ncbi:MAG: M48 family metallopeptidase [Cytophagales bacterium]|nr:M48 family metallopeptidase [Cytophagales bacterium]
MKRIFFLLCVLLLSACAPVPITGRKRVIPPMPASQVNPMALAQYNEFLKTNTLSGNETQVRMVKNVGARLSEAVDRFFDQSGTPELKKQYNWEFNLVENEQMNAWCMPGGKVVFYTGIMPVCKDETGVAVVMGHEIAHAIAEHGGERMSQGLAAQGINVAGAVANEYFSKNPEKTRDLVSMALGMGTQVGMLKYSRVHETEADKIGLVIMAMAGYNPQESIEFWKRMSEMSKGQAPPEFLSTHPSHDTRIENLKRFMPEAMRHYDSKNKF